MVAYGGINAVYYSSAFALCWLAVSHGAHGARGFYELGRTAAVAAGGTSCSLQHAITWRSGNNSSVTVPASQGYACESQGYWSDALLRTCFLPPGHGLESLLQAMAAVIAKVWIGGQATKFSRMAL